MWPLETLKTKRVKLDLSSSGQPNVEVTQLWTNHIELINAVESVNWSDSAFQFRVCGLCGYVGCKPQDWVEIKRTTSIVLIAPAFTKLREASKHMEHEYLPPPYLLEQGVIYIDRANYESQLCQVAPFPDFATLSPLLAWEAAKIFQLEAPSQVFGQILTPPKLYQDIAIASSEGNFMEQTSALIALVESLSKANRTVDLRRVTEDDQIISLYLDISGCPEWAALSYDGSHYSLYLHPGFVIE